ncbi:MAG: alpha/beta fold hydrolase, partial [Gaiellaceae bacterium]
MKRLLLVHGSVVGGRATWNGQLPLGERFELEIVDRPGFPPNPLVDCVDFERDADLVAGLLRRGDHVVGHSYGGVISLLACALRPELVRSL